MISVCMATYNGEKYIREQVASILAQLDDNDELIISDDNSTDKTIEILYSFEDKRIKILNHTPPECSYRGKLKECFLVQQNFNNALSKAKGDYIFFSDQDDVWKPNKIEVFMPYLKEYDLVISNCDIVNENIELLQKSYLNDIAMKPSFLCYLYKFNYFGCCMAITRKGASLVFPFPKVPILHDIWIFLCLRHKAKCKIIIDSTLMYRRHGTNVSSGSEKSRNSLSFKIKSRLIIFKVYIKNILLTQRR